MTCTRSCHALFALAGLATACSAAVTKPVDPIDLSDQWPTTPSDYYDVTRAWTREGHFLADFDARKNQIFEVFATVKSPQWQAAYADFIAERSKMPASEREAFAAKLRAEAARAYEVEIFFHVDERRANDLQKGVKSNWRLALVDEKGAEVTPAEVSRDRRPRTLIAAEFPHLSAFHTPYLAKFPRTVELFGPGHKQFSLKLANARGGIEMIWKTRD
jgi:hypothetical protein